MKFTRTFTQDFWIEEVEDGYTIETNTEIARIIAESMFGLLKQHNAENFLVMKLNGKDGGVFLTIQKEGSKSPSEKYLDIFEENKILRDMLDKKENKSIITQLWNKIKGAKK